MISTQTDALADALAEVRQFAEREASEAEDSADQFAELGNEAIRNAESLTAQAYRDIGGLLGRLNDEESSADHQSDTSGIQELAGFKEQLLRLCEKPFDILEIEDDDGTITKTAVVRAADVAAVLDGSRTIVRERYDHGRHGD